MADRKKEVFSIDQYLLSMDQSLHNFPELERFIDAQLNTFEAAISELRSGEKSGHWMWFIFPQVTGLGFSPMANLYAMQSVDEARGYLLHPILGMRLKLCSEALLTVEGRTAEEIMGLTDSMKLFSSMTLFAEISSKDSLFARVLEKYFCGEKDAKTIDFITKGQSKSKK